MKYIAIQEDGACIEDATDSIDFVKKIVKYHMGNNKAFEILADSGKMSIEELVVFANENILTSDDAIESIYELGKQIV